MAARSNFELLHVPEVTALEVSDSRNLPSRWNATSQPNQSEPAEVTSAPRPKATSRGRASVKPEISWLVGMICWLVAFML